MSALNNDVPFAPVTDLSEALRLGSRPGAPRRATECSGCDDFSCLSDATFETLARVSDERAVEWFVAHRLVPRPQHDCTAQPQRATSKNGNVTQRIWRCQCTRKWGLFNGSFAFRSTKLPPRTLLLLMWAWAHNCSNKVTTRLFKVNKNTVSTHFALFDEVAAQFNMREKGFEPLVGYVAADEMAIGKRKYHKGKRQRHGGIHWFQGVCEATHEGEEKFRVRRMLLRFLYDRTAATLYNNFEKLVDPAAQVRTDEWKGGLRLHETHPHHVTVKHAAGFKAPDGVHTNWIEGSFGALSQSRSNASQNLKGKVRQEGMYYLARTPPLKGYARTPSPLQRRTRLPVTPLSPLPGDPRLRRRRADGLRARLRLRASRGRSSPSGGSRETTRQGLGPSGV